MNIFSFLLLNLIFHIGCYNVHGTYLLVDVESEAQIDTGRSVMKAIAKDEEIEFAKCLKHVTEQVMGEVWEICQKEKGDDQKCQEWIKENTDTFQNLIVPCLKQSNGREHETQRISAKKDIQQVASRDTPSCSACLWCAAALDPLVMMACTICQMTCHD